MRITRLITTLFAALCAVAFLTTPLLAEEGQEESTEVATELEQEKTDTPPVEAKPAEGEPAEEEEGAQK